MAFTGFSIGALDIRTRAINIETIDGWDEFPGTREQGIVRQYTPGEYLGGRRFYAPKDISFVLLVFPCDAAGAVTTTPAEHLQDNLDALFGALHSNGLITITRTMPDASTRTMDVRVLQAIPVSSGNKGALIRRVVVRARTAIPFWHGAAATPVTATGTLTNLGTAPIADAIITFSGAGSVTLGDDSLVTTGACVVDIGEGTVTNGGVDADNLLTYANPWLMVFEPGANAVTVSGASIAYFHTYF